MYRLGDNAPKSYVVHRRLTNSVSIIYCSGPFEDLSQYTKHYVVRKKTNSLRYNNISYNANIMVLPT